MRDETGDHRHHPCGRLPGRIHSRRPNLGRSLADRVCFTRLSPGVSAVRVRILCRHVTTVVMVMFRLVVRLRFRLRLTGRCRWLLLLTFGWRTCGRLRGVCVAWLYCRLTFAEAIDLRGLRVRGNRCDGQGKCSECQAIRKLHGSSVQARASGYSNAFRLQACTGNGTVSLTAKGWTTCAERAAVRPPTDRCARDMHPRGDGRGSDCHSHITASAKARRPHRLRRPPCADSLLSRASGCACSRAEPAARG